MSRVGLEPAISVFKRAKTFHALDRTATVVGLEGLGQLKDPVTSSGNEPVTFRKISAFLSLQLDFKLGMVTFFLVLIMLIEVFGLCSRLLLVISDFGWWMG
jgi:hypothetical protein